MSSEITFYQPVLETHTSLEVFAESLNQREITHKCSTLKHALKMGRDLLRAKAEVKSQKLGKWEAWLLVSCPAISPRTARLFVQIANSWDFLLEYLRIPKNWDDFSESEMATVAIFTIKDAQKAMNERSTRKRKVTEPDFIANFKSSLHKFDQSIDLLLINDLGNANFDTLQDLDEELTTVAGRIALVREKLNNYLGSQPDRLSLGKSEVRLLQLAGCQKSSGN